MGSYRLPRARPCRPALLTPYRFRSHVDPGAAKAFSAFSPRSLGHDASEFTLSSASCANGPTSAYARLCNTHLWQAASAMQQPRHNRSATAGQGAQISARIPLSGVTKWSVWQRFATTFALLRPRSTELSEQSFGRLLGALGPRPAPADVFASSIAISMFVINFPLFYLAAAAAWLLLTHLFSVRRSPACRQALSLAFSTRGISPLSAFIHPPNSRPRARAPVSDTIGFAKVISLLVSHTPVPSSRPSRTCMCFGHMYVCHSGLPTPKSLLSHTRSSTHPAKMFL